MAGGAGGPGVTRGNLISAGFGAVVGGVSTLVGDLGVRQLLDNSPLIGLAVFTLLAAFAVFVLGMVMQRAGRSFGTIFQAAAGLVVVATIFAGLSVFVAPQRLSVKLLPTPDMSDLDMPKIQVMGPKAELLDWKTPIDYQFGRGDQIYFNLTNLRDRYRERETKARDAAEAEKRELQANCVAVLKETAGDRLGIGARNLKDGH